MAKTLLFVGLAFLLTAGVFLTAEQVDARTQTAQLTTADGGCCGTMGASQTGACTRMDAAQKEHCSQMDASACPEMDATACPYMNGKQCDKGAMKSQGECPYSGARTGTGASDKADANSI